MHTQRLKLASICSGLLLLAGTACVAARDITVVGTGDGLEILKSVSDAFNRANPGIKVSVPPSIGSGGAIVAVGSNREILGRVARPLTNTEEASGIAYRPIFHVPTAFFVHPEVPVRNLTPAQLRGIFAGEISSWKQVGGPDLRIRVVRREEADSSLAVLRWTIPAFQDLKLSERSKLAVTTQEAIDSIKENPGAIGFGSYSVALAKELGVVSISGVAPTDKDYAPRVTLALIYKPERIDGDIKRYIEFFWHNEVKGILESYGARPAER